MQSFISQDQTDYESTRLTKPIPPVRNQSKITFREGEKRIF